MFLPVPPYEALAGEPEVVLGDTGHTTPHVDPGKVSSQKKRATANFSDPLCNPTSVE